MCLVIKQRGWDSMDEISSFVESVVRSRRFFESYLDPKKPLAKPAQAQRLIYQAYRSNGRQRVKLAKRALSLWPDCADAYLLQSQYAASTADSIMLLEKGLEAGERALRAEYKEVDIERLLREADSDEPLLSLAEAEAEAAAGDYAVEFWAQQPTRPYMRVRTELSAQLWEVGDSAEAQGHLRALLRLCPRDFQGNRYLLAGFLVDDLTDEPGAFQELGALLARYESDHSAHWLYTRALWLLKQSEDEPKRNKAAKRKTAVVALLRAFEANPFVPALLIDPDAVSMDFSSLAPGSFEEAADYLDLAGGAWTENTTALTQLLELFFKEIGYSEATNLQ